MSTESTDDIPDRDYRPTRKQWLLLAALFLFETMVWQQFVLAFFMICFGTGTAFFRFIRPGPTLRPTHFRLPLAYVVAGVLCYGVFWFNNSAWAPYMAEQIAEACHDYRDDHGAFPEDLGDLTPEYLAVVPPAKLTVAWSGFEYVHTGNGDPFLFWVAVPPFGTPTYDIVGGRRGYID